MTYSRSGHRIEKKYSPDQERDAAGRFGAGSGEQASTNPGVSRVDGVTIGHPGSMKPLAVLPNKKAAAKAGMEMRRAGNPNVFIVTADNQHVMGITGMTGRQAMIYEILAGANKV